MDPASIYSAASLGLPARGPANGPLGAISFVFESIFGGMDQVFNGNMDGSQTRGAPLDVMDRISVELAPKECQCHVCIEDFVPNAELCCCLPCDHRFHSHCIREWLSRNDSCPSCREPVSPYLELDIEPVDEHLRHPVCSFARHATSTMSSSSGTTDANSEGQGYVTRGRCTVEDASNARMLRLACGCFLHFECMVSFLRVTGMCANDNTGDQTRLLNACPSCHQPIAFSMEHGGVNLPQTAGKVNGPDGQNGSASNEEKTIEDVAMELLRDEL